MDNFDYAKPEFAGQLFFRETNNPGLYMVCGLVRTNKPIDCETVYPVEYGKIYDKHGENIRKISIGNTIDGILMSRIWRMK